MVVKVYANNSAKTRREISRASKSGEYQTLSDLFYGISEEARSGLQDNPSRITGYAKFIKGYKKRRLLSIKQISFDPINKVETWAIKDKRLLFTINISREIGELGIENIYINSMWAHYKSIRININGHLYSEMGLSGGYNEIIRLFRLLTDYTKEINRKEVKK